ncbi:multidrug resistance-associated protein 1-like [Babylonia areolata]|uniref:multidrug resistance-associated protein 1-like n=1 Tax=Babylonia areolata TaxID=304850 RepID=UPI003FCF5C98
METLLCGNETFWDTQKTWDGDWPELSACFQNLVLSCGPCLVLWAELLVYFPWLLCQQQRARQRDSGFREWLFWAKQMSAIVLLVLCLIEVLIALGHVGGSRDTDTSSVAVADVLAPCFRSASMVMVVVVVGVERGKGTPFPSSPTLFVFWLLVVVTDLVCGVVYFGVRHVQGTERWDLMEMALVVLSMAVSGIQLALHSLSSLAPSTSQEESPESVASCPSRLTYSWINRLMSRGYKGELLENDVFPLAPRDRMLNAGDKLLENLVHGGGAENANQTSSPSNKTFGWMSQRRQQSDVDESTPLLSTVGATGKDQKERSLGERWGRKRRNTKKVALARGVVRTFWRAALVSNLCKLPHDLLIVTNPLLLGQLIRLCDDVTVPEWRGYVIGLALCASLFLQALLFHLTFHLSMTLGLRVKAALTAAIFRKMLTMGSRGRRESPAGEIINLVSVDTQHVTVFLSFLPYAWSGPVQVALCVFCLHGIVGNAAFAGACLLLVLLPLNGWLMSRLGHLQTSLMEHKDTRLKRVTEILSAIKTVKVQAWERVLGTRVSRVREAELGLLQRVALLDASQTVCWALAPVCMALLTFSTYVVTDVSGALTSEEVFVTLSYLSLIRGAVTVAPMVVTDIVKASVSLKRLERFLNHDDLNPTSVSLQPMQEATVMIRNATCSWDKDSPPCLKGVNLQTGEGSLVAVVGPTASGKSSLLAAILGELHLHRGDVTVNGLTLSGGQRQRINLARAVYESRDLYLMDDPISAVDNRVGRQIFQELIGQKGLLRDATRIVATSTYHWLPEADVIVVMSEGEVVEVGDYNHLMSQQGGRGHLPRLLASHGQKATRHRTLVTAPHGCCVHDHDLNEPEQEKFYRCLQMNQQGRESEQGKKNKSDAERTLLTPSSTPDSDKLNGVSTSSSAAAAAAAVKARKVSGLPDDVEGTGSSAVETQTSFVFSADLKAAGDYRRETSADSEEPTNFRAARGSSAEAPVIVIEETSDSETCHLISDLRTGDEADMKYVSFPAAKRHHPPNQETAITTRSSSLFSQSASLSPQSASLLSQPTSPPTQSSLPSAQSRTFADENWPHMGSGDLTSAQHGDADNGHMQALMEHSEDGVLSDSPGDRSRDDLSVAMVTGQLSGRGRQQRERELLTSMSCEVLPKCRQPHRLVDEEHVAVGRVKWHVYGAMARALGVVFFVAIVTSFVMYHMSSVGANYWLSYWTDMTSLLTDVTDGNHDNTFYLAVYGAFGVAQCVFVAAFGVLLAFRRVRAARSLHRSLLDSVLSSPLHFFHRNPSARILNRMSRDLEVVDMDVWFTVEIVLDSLCYVISTCVIVCFSSLYAVLGLVPVVAVYCFIQRYYVRTSRQLRRLESKTRSPVYAHLSHAFSGCVVLRAAGGQATERAVETAAALVDSNLRFAFCSNTATRWLGVRVAVMGVVVVGVATMVGVALRDRGTGGLLGLTITYALDVTENLNWLVRMLGDLETNAVSVERILEYSDLTPEEDTERIPTVVPCHQWPREGRVQWVKLWARYDNSTSSSATTSTTSKALETAPVLRHVDCTIKAGEKVGVVGRTGAGKTSLWGVLLGLLTIEEGAVLIDDVDTRSVPLHVLRRRIAVMSQEPLVLEGSIRLNLDPEGVVEGEERLWAVLDQTQLTNHVRALPGGLDYVCQPDGQGFSAGQKQLLCLARLLLRQCRVMVLDEVTSSVDRVTEVAICQAVREACADRTVIIVSHRLTTVQLCDRVMVMDKGRVVEVGSPCHLLADPFSHFSRLAASSDVTK